MKRILAISFLILTVITTGCSAEGFNQTYAQTEQGKLGTWMWDATNINNPDIIKELKDLNIGEVFLNVGWEPKEKQFYLKENPKKYNKFIQLANKDNIEVQALYGNADWSLEKNKNLLMKEVQVVLEYNKKYPNRFSAVHLDIEPHILTQWKENEEEILSQYLNNIKVVKELISNHNKKNRDNLKLIVDIPPWYDQYSISNQNFAKDILNTTDGVGLMIYTKYKDYFIETALKYLELANENNKTVNVGTEFQKEYQDITLYNFDKTTLMNYFNESLVEFTPYNSFKNISVHTYNSYKEYMK